MASTNKCTTDFEAGNELICMANNTSYWSHFTIFLQINHISIISVVNKGFQAF